jgi:archaellum component FlaC
LGKALSTASEAAVLSTEQAVSALRRDLDELDAVSSARGEVVSSLIGRVVELEKNTTERQIDSLRQRHEGVTSDLAKRISEVEEHSRGVSQLSERNGRLLGKRIDDFDEGVRKAAGLLAEEVNHLRLEINRLRTEIIVAQGRLEQASQRPWWRRIL